MTARTISATGARVLGCSQRDPRRSMSAPVDLSAYDERPAMADLPEETQVSLGIGYLIERAGGTEELALLLRSLGYDVPDDIEAVGRALFAAAQGRVPA
jgi:hypothetical protein